MHQILVIEDEESLREEILEMLSLEQFQVQGAANGQVGIELAQQQQPDLIVCDVGLPELNGFDVLKLLRQNLDTAIIPFIFLTARADKSDLRQGMALGADDYLIKPFTRRELLDAIDVRLQKQSTLDRHSQKQLDQLRQNITLSLPHELHTPLSGIISMAELLIAEYGSIDSTEAKEMLETIRASGERLYRLTQNFMLYAELELMATDAARMAAVRSQTTPVPVRQVIKATACQTAQQADRTADLQMDLRDVIAPIAEVRLQKIVEELIGNACKFSTPGTPICIISRSSPSFFCLEVIDYGRGMTPAQIDQIGAYMQFERKLYEQQGSGMGLAIVKRLVELYGGKLTIESILGRKTKVRVVFE